MLKLRISRVLKLLPLLSFILLSWLLEFALTTENSMASMQNSFDERDAYINQTQLGNSDVIGNGDLFNKGDDVSNLSGMGDQDMVSRGGKELNKSESGKLIQKSETVKTDAIIEHKINANNPIWKNSMKIEANPMEDISGADFVTGESVSKTVIRKTCLDGVDFEVDVLKQLVLDSEFIDVWGKWQDRTMAITEQDINPGWAERKMKENILGKDDWVQAFYMRVREEDPAVNRQLRALIIEREKLNPEYVGEKVRVGYIDKAVTIIHTVMVPAPSLLHYQYRERIREHKIKGEYWEVITEAQEELADANECHEVSRKCLEAGNKLFFERFTVNRPCWKEQITYACMSDPQNGCKHLVRQGCILENSSCVKNVGGVCLLWQRNYICYGEKKELRCSLKDAPIFCLGGDCHTPVIEQNDDIHNVAYLAVLDEMRKDMKTNPITVFTGDPLGCRKNITSFLNCCSSMKGWGKDVRLGQCKGEEKALAMKRDKKLCHYIGSYCAETDPIFKKCITRKSTYCCFNSKLARIFQQQGKAQLGISFGGAKSPDCRGFTVEELTRIDFSKFDLEELFADLIADAKAKMAKSFPTQIAGQMPTIQAKHYDPNYLTEEERRELERRRLEEEKQRKLEEERERQKRLEEEKQRKLAEERERHKRLEEERQREILRQQEAKKQRKLAKENELYYLKQQMVSAKDTADNYRSNKIVEDQVRVNNFTSNGNLYMVGRTLEVNLWYPEYLRLFQIYSDLYKSVNKLEQDISRGNY